MRQALFKPPSFAQIFKDSKRIAEHEYPMLLGIRECIPRIYAKETDALLAAYWRGWKQKFWTTDNIDYVKHADLRSDGNVSGSTCVAEKDGETKVAVFLRKDLNQRGDVQAGVLFATLAHELGHVDDIANAVNIVPDKPADMIAAEEYAHHFACAYIMTAASRADMYAEGLPHSELKEWRSAFAELFRPVMAFYIDEMLGGLKALPVPSISTAAANTLDSPKCETYKRFAGDYLQT
jgi:hypothetical protein